jgi:hypothetical protein
MHDMLDVTCYDYDNMGTNEFLGQVAIPMAMCAVSERPIQQWFALLDKYAATTTQNKTKRGELLLKLVWTDADGKVRDGEAAPAQGAALVAQQNAMAEQLVAMQASQAQMLAQQQAQFEAMQKQMADSHSKMHETIAQAIAQASAQAAKANQQPPASPAAPAMNAMPQSPMGAMPMGGMSGSMPMGGGMPMSPGMAGMPTGMGGMSVSPGMGGSMPLYPSFDPNAAAIAAAQAEAARQAATAQAVATAQAEAARQAAAAQAIAAAQAEAARLAAAASAAASQLGDVQVVEGQLTDVAIGQNELVGCNASGDVYRKTGDGAWTAIPGKLKRVALGADGTLWGLASNDSIWQFANGQWIGVPGALTSLSVGSAQHVIGSNAGGAIYRFVNGSWAAVPAPFLSREVSIGRDGTVYAVAQDQKIFKLEPNGQWTNVPGLLVDIGVASAAEIVGVNSSGIVYRLLPNENNRWEVVNNTGVVARVAFGASGIALVGADGSVRRVPLKRAASFAATSDIDGQVVELGVGKGEIIGCNSIGGIWRKVGNNGWSAVPGQAKSIDLAEDGTLFAVGQNQEVLRWINGAWQVVPGQLVNISVGSAHHIIGVNSAGQIWRFESLTNGWSPVAAPFAAAQVSVGKDGALFAVARDDAIYKLSGSAWTQIPGQLAQISVYTAEEVVGVNRAGTVYQLTGAQGWNVLDFGVVVKSVSIGQAGIYAVNKANDCIRVKRRN